MIDLDIALDKAALSHVQGALGLTPAAVRAASRRTVAKIAKELRSKSHRESAKALGVQLRAIAGRFRIYRKVHKDGSLHKVWAGMNMVRADSFRYTPMKSGGGVRIGNVQVDGAFIVIGKNSKKKLVMRRDGRERYPISLAMVPIDQQVEAAVRKTAQSMDSRFMEVLAQELRFEMHKLTKNRTTFS